MPHCLKCHNTIKNNYKWCLDCASGSGICVVANCEEATKSSGNTVCWVHFIEWNEKFRKEDAAVGYQLNYSDWLSNRPRK